MIVQHHGERVGPTANLVIGTENEGGQRNRVLSQKRKKKADTKGKNHKPGRNWWLKQQAHRCFSLAKKPVCQRRIHGWAMLTSAAFGFFYWIDGANSFFFFFFFLRGDGANSWMLRSKAWLNKGKELAFHDIWHLKGDWLTTSTNTLTNATIEISKGEEEKKKESEDKRKKKKEHEPYPHISTTTKQTSRTD